MNIDVIDFMDFDDIDDINALGTFRRPNKYRLRVNPFKELNELDFKHKYKFSKLFVRKIVDLIKDKLPHDTRGGSILPEMQVVCALRSWGRHEIQDDTAGLHGVSQPAVSKISKNVAKALAQVSHRFIKMPSSLDEEENTMRQFRCIADFPKVIGAIGCTHIKIKERNSQHGQTYINRKGYPSINVQVVCDADLKIMDIVARWRGSVNDAHIFRKSRLKQRFEAGAFSGILLADNGYSCTPYLFTPILNPSSPQEERYNNAHTQTRNTIERCFELWKQRFRCLLRGMFGDIETVKMIIVACAVLHNIAIDMKEDQFSTYDDSNQPSVIISNAQNTIRGNIKRRQFIDQYF